MCLSLSKDFKRLRINNIALNVILNNCPNRLILLLGLQEEHLGKDTEDRQVRWQRILLILADIVDLTDIKLGGVWRLSKKLLILRVNHMHILIISCVGLWVCLHQEK
jgi:hypothetical protein